MVRRSRLNRSKPGMRELLQFSLTVVAEAVGVEWIEKRRRRWKRTDWEHPLVAAYRAAHDVLDAGDEAIEASEHVLRITFLARHLLDLNDFSSCFRNDLRDPKKCEKAEYELQIGAAFKRLGYELERPTQGPDWIASKGATRLFLECKRKRSHTDEDHAARQFWRRLGDEVFDALRSANRTGVLYVTSDQDPDPGQHEALSAELVRLAREATGEVRRTLSLAGTTYWIEGAHFASAGALPSHLKAQLPTIPPGSQQWFLELAQQFRRGAETVRAEAIVSPGRDAQPGVPDSERTIVAFRLFAGNSTARRDYVKGVIDAITEVRKREQLPKSGPGIIYIALPLHHEFGLLDRLNEAAASLAPKLKGEQNRRINAVVLTGTTPNPNPLYAKPGQRLSMSTFGVKVIHDNPRTPLPKECQLFAP